jgi:uncharacterized protein
MPADFLHLVTRNRHNATILSRWTSLALPNAWLVAGCVFQTVWNLQSGQPAEAGIKDYDIFYFDPTDLSLEREQRAQARAEALYHDLGIAIEVANQARVHLWYPQHFGRPYPPLRSVEEGIGRFLMLEACVGVRPGQCHAPFGTDGLLAGTLTPNPATPFPELYAAKAESYRARWPWLVAHQHSEL